LNAFCEGKTITNVKYDKRKPTELEGKPTILEIKSPPTLPEMGDGG
jgi:hypothetical protein